MDSFYTLAITLFFAIGALGIIPTYLKLVEKFNTKKQIMIALRELVIALAIMVIFYYLGHVVLKLLSLDRATTQIAGGIVIFLIGIRLIFPNENDQLSNVWLKGNPLIVPIATPLMAGPSVLAVIMIYSRESQSDLVMLGAIFAAWFLSSIIFLLAKPLYKYLGEKVLSAAQSLMGLVIAMIAVQMLIEGAKKISEG